MATGYTYALLDDPTMTFAQFAMRCARAFGACVEMREEPMDKAPPDVIEPSASVRESLDKAYEAHREAEALTLAEGELRAAADYERQVASAREYDAKHEQETARFRGMLAEVDAWVPPTKDHVGLKEFMHQQIDSSIMTKYEYRVTKQTGAQWLEARRKSTAEDVTRAARDWEKERASATSRTGWLRDLRKSLP